MPDFTIDMTKAVEIRFCLTINRCWNLQKVDKMYKFMGINNNLHNFYLADMADNESWHADSTMLWVWNMSPVNPAKSNFNWTLAKHTQYLIFLIVESVEIFCPMGCRDGNCFSYTSNYKHTEETNNKI